MKTTLNLRKELIDEAISSTGIKEKTAVIHLGLEELIRKAARERLMKLAGKMPSASFPNKSRRLSSAES
jgi:hypothetical protein